MTGGISAAIDLIQSEYGWHDDHVLDLTVARFRQIISGIEQRRRALFIQSSRLTEWQTRTLAQFIAATSESAELAKRAAEIKLTLDGEADTDETAPGADDPAVFVEQGSQVALQRNAAGSFEKLTQRLR